MIKINVFVVICFLILFFSSVCFAIPPKKIIERTNLQADVIVVGKIENISSSNKSHYFELKVIDVVKGYERVREGDIIKIFFKSETPEKKGIKAHTMGERKVKVKRGQMVICYLKPLSKLGGYKLIMEGLSIVPLKP